MARYIKTDIIAKIVFDKWKECEKIEHIIPEIRRAIMYESTTDVVPVVRCKDCVHHIDAPKTTDVWCENVDGLLPKDWFCADGERGGTDV